MSTFSRLTGGARELDLELLIMRVFSDPFVYRIGDRLYATQPEYSNELHGCAVH